MRCLAEWDHALTQKVWARSKYAVKRNGVHRTTLPTSYVVVQEKLGSERAKTWHTIFFICVAIFNLGIGGYGANDKLRHYGDIELR